MSLALLDIHKRIHSCSDCDRLRDHCLKTAEVKRRSYENETYWGKPVAGFGDPNARLMIVGLAPAAHGANRTGRIFTGDRSGDWLYRALFRAGFANQPTSVHSKDGLILRHAYVSCVVRCAPPENKPNPDEQARCSPFLEKEIQALPGIRVFVALGQIAFQGLWKILKPHETRPAFKHGGRIVLSPTDKALDSDSPPGAEQLLLLSYHPSQQNTFTGRLTEPMFDSVFSQAKSFLA